jgi:hypothetical protein
LKLNIFVARTLRMFVKNIFCTGHLYNRRHALQWKNCALALRAIAIVCRQLSNAFLTRLTPTLFPPAGICY